VSAVSIRKGVPLPEPRKRGKPARWPFGVMDVGDSFAFPAADVKSVRAALRRHCKVHGGSYAVRQCAAGYGCWRVG